MKDCDVCIVCLDAAWVNFILLGTVVTYNVLASFFVRLPELYLGDRV